jgi:hypothetical protein
MLDAQMETRTLVLPQVTLLQRQFSPDRLTKTRKKSRREDLRQETVQ